MGAERETTQGSQKRLAVIVTSDVIGGHEMQLVQLLPVLRADRNAVIFTTCEATAVYFDGKGFDVRRIIFPLKGKIWQQWHAGRSLSKKLKPLVRDCDDFLVSGGTIEACVAPGRALKLLRPKTCVTAYIPMYIDRSMVFGSVGVVYNCLSRMFIGSIDRFITINRIQARLITRNYARPVRVIRNVIAGMTALSLDHGPRLIFVGRLDDLQKDVTGLISLLDHEENPFRALHIYGDGPDAADIRRHALSARWIAIFFHGWASHDRLSNELGKRDVLIMNSRWEGEPMIVGELAACGIQTVARDVPGFRGLLLRRSRFNSQIGLLAILQRVHAELQVRGVEDRARDIDRIAPD